MRIKVGLIIRTLPYCIASKIFSVPEIGLWLRVAVCLIGLQYGLITPLFAQDSIDYTPYDSTFVVTVLKETPRDIGTDSLILYLGKKLIGIPYVGKTLEHNDSEKLVVNLRQLDCTTFVENVLAFSRCVKEQQTSFQAFCHHLRAIRYRQAQVDYVHRLHYFSDWIIENQKENRVEEIQGDDRLWTGKQNLQLDFMTTHVSLYPMLKGHPARIKVLRDTEKKLSGGIVRYIPKALLNQGKMLRRWIRNGDILAIVTGRKGLDTSHLGFAVWHGDKLHLLNASLLRKKVVDESQTLFEYMQGQRLQKGIRVIRVE